MHFGEQNGLRFSGVVRARERVEGMDFTKLKQVQSMKSSNWASDGCSLPYGPVHTNQLLRGEHSNRNLT